MKAALVQQDILWGDVRGNLAHLDAMLSEAPEADLYVLPEMFTTGFATPAGATVEHEALGTGLEWMKRKARELDAAISGSIAIQLAPAGGADSGAYPQTKCVNRLYFVKPDGSAAHYDKRHLFSYGGEGERFTAGRHRIVVEWKGLRFLLCVCYDLRFPVWLRNRCDYDAIIVCADWPGARRLAWDTLLRARAIENQCYVLGTNRCGDDPSCSYSGGTALIHPYGETVSAVPDHCEGFACGDIDLGFITEYQKKFPALEGADRFTIDL